MPAGYEKLKARLKKEHPKMSDKTAEKHAAMIWNHMMKGTGKTVGKGRA